MAGPVQELFCNIPPQAIRMHMPGHKGRLPQAWLQPGFDLTELPQTDDLFAPQGAFREAAEAAARAAGAAFTLPLSAGATSGVLAMLLHCLAPGDALILPRNAHVSALSGCALAGAEPVYLWPRQGPQGWTAIEASDVCRAIEAHPRAKAVLLTRPDYFGQCIPLEKIAEACRAHGLLLLVDEAHGAHWNWTQTGPRSAGAYGADLWVQSAHKTLPVLTGGAWLHAGPGISLEGLRHALHKVHTTSPSFLTLGTLDAARDWMDRFGRAALVRLRAQVEDFWQSAARYGGYHNAQETAPQPADPLRLVLEAGERGYTGRKLQAALADLGVLVEMADDRRVVMIPTVWDRPDDLLQVAERLGRLPPLPQIRYAPTPAFAHPEQAVPLRRVDQLERRWVPLAEAAGRIAAAPVGVVPPGVPLLMPGERIPKETLTQIASALGQGASVFGVCQNQLPCVAEEEASAV